MHYLPVVTVASLLILAPRVYAQESDVPSAPPAESTPPTLAPAPTVETEAVVEEQAAVEVAPVAVPEALPEASSYGDYGPAPVPKPADVSRAPAETGLKVTASFFTRYELREGYDDIGRAHPRYRESDLVFYRARLGLSTTPIDIGKGKHVTLLFEPQASGFWADKAGTLADGALDMHQATVRISGASYWMDAGRFEMSYGDELVIGSVGWHQTGRTFDGLRSHIALDKGWVDVFATQVLEDPLLVKPYGAGDQYFGGAYAGLGPMMGNNTELDTYVLGQVWPRFSVSSELGLQITVGSRFKKNLGSADLRAEAGAQWGTGSQEQLAWQGDAEVGTNMGTTRIAVGGWYASGDDPTTAKNEGWDELYPTAHKFMGLADIIGPRTNITGGVLRLRHKLDSIGLGADANVFLRPETPDGVDAYTGFELDSWVLKNLGTGLGLRGGYSLFVPNDGGQFGTGDLAHYVEVQLAFALK